MSFILTLALISDPCFLTLAKIKHQEKMKKFQIWLIQQRPAEIVIKRNLERIKDNAKVIGK